MLGQHLEAHEVGVLEADLTAINEEVILLKHQLAEAVHIDRPAHAEKEL